MLDLTITVERGNKKPWVFELTSAGNYICKQRKHIYRLVWEKLGSAKPCWIGRYAWTKDGTASLYTVEDEIGATAVVFSFGRYVFD